MLLESFVLVCLFQTKYVGTWLLPTQFNTEKLCQAAASKIDDNLDSVKAVNDIRCACVQK